MRVMMWHQIVMMSNRDAYASGSDSLESRVCSASGYDIRCRGI